MTTQGRAPVSADSDEVTGGWDWRPSRVASGRSLPSVLLWVMLAGSAAGLGFAGRLTADESSPIPIAASAVHSPGATATAGDAVARQASEWERRYRAMYPTTMTGPEREHYRDWQQQYEQQHPQD